MSDEKKQEQVTARIISVERVGIGSGPISIVVDAFAMKDAKAVVEALAAVGVESMCVLPWGFETR